MPTDPNLVRKWLKMLGALNDAAMGTEEFEMRLAVLAPALAAEFPPDVFTPDTARGVARKSRYFPVFGEICAFLEPIAQQFRERRRYLALPAPRQEHPEPYELPPAPEWCFDRRPRHFGRPELDELAIQPPLRSVQQQLAILHASEKVDA
jgi:hypothetical protein